MPTLTQQRAAVAALREERQADFEAWERDRIARDEMTDQAERLAAPMTNTFEYALGPDGLHTDLGEYILPVLQDGYKVAEHNAALNPDWQFELERRGIEIEEQQQIEDFARSAGSGVRMTSLSLDKSNYAAMRATAAQLGFSMPAERPSSEDILRGRMWLGTPPALVVFSPIPDAVRLHGVKIGAYDRDREKMLVRVVTLNNEPLDDHKNLINLIRDTYDQSLHDQFGGEWFAGRENALNVKDAMAFIGQQTDLVDQHVEIVQSVYRSVQDKKERLRQLAPHRYNLAAALADRMEGRRVTSLNDSGNAARAEGKTFDGDCPTDVAEASAQLEALGYKASLPEEIMRCVNCPICKKLVDARKKFTRKEKSIECLSCFAKVDLVTGERLDKRAKRMAKKLAATAIRQTTKLPGPKKVADSLVKIGNRLMRRQERLTVGGTTIEYVDVKTDTK